MKPLQLTMRAFGPYAGEQTIELAAVCQRELFLIHGPTGGGKTTILDAICYALYGQTTGDRSGEQMRCQLAEAKTLTEVELEFALGETRYRVKRGPRQKRPAARGGGMTDAPAWAELHRISPAADVLASRPTDVTAQIERLLGFSIDQFRQVIVLPQGKFRELLLARSEQREQILQALFGTAFFERLQEALAEASRDVVRKLAEQRERRNIVLEQGGAEAPEELTASIVKKSQELEAQRQIVESHAAKAKTAGEQLSTGRAVVEKLDECERAEKQLKQLEQQRPEIDRKQKLIAAAERASKVLPVEQEYRTRAQEVPAREKAIAQAQGRRDRAIAAAQAAGSRLQVAIQDSERAKEHRQQLGKVQSLKERIGRLAAAETELCLAQAALAEQESALSGARRTQKQAADEKARVAEQLKALRELAAQAPLHEQRATELKRLLDARAALDELSPQIATLQKTVSAGEAREHAATGTVRAAKVAYADLVLAWKQSSAARLAGELKPDAPCPVCGSLEHPSPARSTGSMPSDEELNAAEKAIAVAEAEQKRVAAKLAEIREKLATLIERQSAQQSTLGEQTSNASELQTELAQVRQAAKLASDAQQQLPGLEAREKQLAADLEALEKEIAAQDAGAQKARDAVTAAGTSRNECLSDLPEALRTQQAWSAEVARLEGLIRAADAEFAAAQSAATAAEAALAAADSAFKQAGDELAQAQRSVDAARTAFLQAIESQGFASEHEYAAAKLTDAQIAAHRDWIDKTRRQIHEAEGLLNRAHEVARGLVRPDLPALQASAAAADAALRSALQMNSDLEAECNRLRGLEAQLKQIAGEFAALERQYETIGKLAESATGTNPKKLKFHRFVLGFLLDDVLWAASQRLKAMSRGRYQLRRVEEVVDKRTTGGLELEVFDAHTGQSRPVATLSGGESFQASLSLSLGLADVVQNRSGGIRMETMFIDEGFGSLDADALDEAMEAIRDLQKGGRVVGIISHVPELRQLVSARIEVVADGRGSSAKIHCV